jgi:DNA-binding winged helix-turn-helix (wHTH) protein
MTLSTVRRFGDFELDLAAGELRRRGARLALQDQPLRLLAELVQRPGELVSREELKKTLWGDDVFVDFEAGLNTAVRRVREVLGDSAVSPRFVETVPRRGYRFVAAVEGPSDGADDPARARALGREPAVWVLTAALLAAGLGWWLGRSDMRGPTPTRLAGVEGDARVHMMTARHFSDLRTRDGLEKAIAAYQSALAAEPALAQAYSGIASCYLLLGIYDYWRPLEAFTPARSMVARALELDDRSASAQLVAGMLSAFGDWKLDAAEARLDRALELDDRLTEAYLLRGVLETFRGNHEAGLAATRRALELEPVSPVLNTMLGWQLFFARRPDEALAQSRHTLELAPDYFDAWDNLKWMYLSWGDETQAVAAWRRAERIEHGKETELAAALAAYGLRPVAEEVARRSVEAATRDDGEYRSPYDVALNLALIGDEEAALDWLERSFAEHETDLLALPVDPRLDGLRGSARFQKMIESLAAAER